MFRSCAVFCAAVLCFPLLSAAGREPLSRDAAAIDVLDAEAKGLVTVKYVPNDSRTAQIVVRNVANKPLTLRLPAAFAGVPVLAQLGGGLGGMGGGMNQGAGFGAGGIGGGPQTVGGGGMGGGMGGMGGGQFSIPPEGTRSIRVTTVCLEHGKPEPSPRYPYKLAELESFSSDPQLAAVMEALGRGEIPQRVAQAVAWHVANGLTWEQLAAEKIDHAGGVPDEPFFAPAELAAARHVAAAVAAAHPRPVASETSTGR